MNTFLYGLIVWLVVRHDFRWSGGKVAILFHYLYGHREFLPVAHLLGLDVMDVRPEDKAKPSDFDFAIVGRVGSNDHRWSELFKKSGKSPLLLVSSNNLHEIYEMPLPHASKEWLNKLGGMHPERPLHHE